MSRSRPGMAPWAKSCGARGDDGLGEVEVRFGLREVEVGLGVVLGDGGFGGSVVGGLGSGVGALVVHDGGGEVTVFERGEELAGFDVGSALHVELFDRGGDLGGDRRLRERGEGGVGGDLLADASLLGMGGLDVDQRSGSGLFLLAAERKQRDAASRRDKFFNPTLRDRAAKDGAPELRWPANEELWLGAWACLDGSCEELEIGEGGLIAGDAVFASEFGGDE